MSFFSYLKRIAGRSFHGAWKWIEVAEGLLALVMYSVGYFDAELGHKVQVLFVGLLAALIVTFFIGMFWAAHQFDKEQRLAMASAGDDHTSRHTKLQTEISTLHDNHRAEVERLRENHLKTVEVMQGNHRVEIERLQGIIDAKPAPFSDVMDLLQRLYATGIRIAESRSGDAKQWIAKYVAFTTNALIAGYSSRCERILDGNFSDEYKRVARGAEHLLTLQNTRLKEHDIRSAFTAKQLAEVNAMPGWLDSTRGP